MNPSIRNADPTLNHVSVFAVQIRKWQFPFKGEGEEKMPVKDANNEKPVIELNLKDLDGVSLSNEKRLTAADIAKKVEKKNGKHKVKKNGDGTTSITNGNVEIELPPNALSEDVAASVNALTEPEAEKPKAKKAKEPREPRPPRARKYGRLPTASITKQDVSALRAKVAALPEAQRRRIFYEREGADGKLELVPALDSRGLEMYCGIEVEGMVINVPSNDYEIVQYSEAFKPVLDFLAEHHDTATICAGLTHNKLQAHMYIAFPDKFNYIDPTGSKFELGMIVSAGHRDRAIRFDGFGFRARCMNQYYLSQSLGSTSIIHRANAHDRIKSYVDQLAFHIEDLDEHMKISREIGLSVDEVAAWVGENYLAKAADPIVKRYKEDGEHNLLGLYNAITNVMTRFGESGQLEADGLMENLKWAEDLIRVEDGQQDVVKNEFAEVLLAVQSRGRAEA